MAYDLYCHLQSCERASDYGSYFMASFVALPSLSWIHAHVCWQLCAGQGGASRRRARMPATLCYSSFADGSKGKWLGQALGRGFVPDFGSEQLVIRRAVGDCGS